MQTIALGVAVLLAHSASKEIIQSFTTTRQGSLDDIAADGVGMAAGLAAALYLAGVDDAPASKHTNSGGRRHHTRSS